MGRWQTTYYPMASREAIIEWLRETGLPPSLQPLDAAAAFLSRYAALAKHFRGS